MQDGNSDAEFDPTKTVKMPESKKEMSAQHDLLKREMSFMAPVVTALLDFDTILEKLHADYPRAA